MTSPLFEGINEPLNPTVTEEPNDRLTSLSDAMLALLRTEENADVKAIVLLSDASDGSGGMHGYDDTDEAIADMLIHLKAMFEVAGAQVLFTDAGHIRITGGD